MELASATSAEATWPSWVLVVAAVLVPGLLLAGPALRSRYPGAWWLLCGFPAVAFRVVQTWRPLMAGCGLAVSRRPALTVVSGLVGKGAPPLQPRVPRRGLIRPTSGGFVLLVRLLPGQVPEHFVKAAPAMAESWQVHAVRVTSWKPGVVRIVASAVDPLADPQVPKQRGPGHLLRVTWRPGPRGWSTCGASLTG